MDDIISKVLDIEDTKQEKERLTGIYSEKIEQMRRDIESRSDKRIKELDELEEKDGQKT